MSNEKYGIAIDIGTTTLAAALIDNKGRVLKEILRPNSQISHGRDVMSRIHAANSGLSGELRELVCADLTGMITGLISGIKLPIDGVNSGTHLAKLAENMVIAIAGNTAMLHILHGHESIGLGTYPYTPVTLDEEILPAGRLFPDLPPYFHIIKTVLLPGISAFVGADITAGLYAADVLNMNTKKAVLFLDLGTNGEMALITDSGKKIVVCSTAAGPVFEGAGIKHGMRGVKGAISDVFMSGSQTSPTVRCQIIGGGKARGICGSGVLETVSELARLHLIDNNGLLKEPWFSEGFPLVDEIRIYQEDIREVQLAKAAIRAGCEVLPLASGIPRVSIETVLVAGAFGKALPFSRLSSLGLMEPALLSKCRSLGNTSLAGAAKLASEVLNGNEAGAVEAVRDICSRATEISLADRRDFKVCYTSMMGF